MLDVTPKTVVLYTSAENVAELVPAHFPAHSAHADEFHRRGSLLMIGPFGDPQAEGSMAIFTSREAAEEFIAADPFVVHGLVERYEIRDWIEAYAPTPGA